MRDGPPTGVERLKELTEMRFDDAGISRTFYAIFKERCGNIREDPREGDGHLSFVGGEEERNGRGRASRATFCASRGGVRLREKKTMASREKSAEIREGKGGRSPS